MKAIKNNRGFIVVLEEKYQNIPGEFTRLIQESSAVGEKCLEDELEKPGSSFLWVGEDHHLDRKKVKELVKRMQHWLDTGRLKED